MRKSGLFSPSAASYLVFALVGLCLLTSTTSPLDTIAQKLPALQEFDISGITMLLQFYMILGFVGVALNLVTTLAKVNVLTFLCMILDVQYIDMHLYYMQGAGNGVQILFIFFIILSIISLVFNLTNFRAR